MVPILSAEQIRKADQYTIEHEPVKSLDLMERAAQAFANNFIKNFSRSHPVFIFCGYGNNGGDGLAIARLLHEDKFDVSTYVLADKKNYSTDFIINHSRLKKIIPDSIHDLENRKDFPAIKKNSIIVDGLFGSGLNKKITGLAAELIDYLNRQDAVRVAIDIPSGLFAGQFAEGTVFHAHHTYTFQTSKLSFFFPENQDLVGEWDVLDIGLDKNFIASLPCENFLMEASDLKKILHPRKKFDHKAIFGHALIYAGSKGKMGASILSAKACIKSGAGLTTLYIPEGESSVLNVSVPEAMTEEYSLRKRSSHSLEVSKYSALGFGPGIGTDPSQRKNFLSLLKKMKAPAVFDADALNIISKEKNGLKLLPKNSIITPHPKEFERLAGKTTNWMARHQRQMEVSKKHSIYVVLKGAYTCISTPEGKSYFNPTGNPGMAKGGSGDVLTGIIVSLLAQEYTLEEACMLGVYLHGLAADIAIMKSSPYSLIASDIIDDIGDAFLSIMGK